jgi:hypothetical protein
VTTEFPSYERVMTAKARLLLRLADTLGVKVGSDGKNLITITRSAVPPELGRWLHAELCKRSRAVAKIIEQENNGGRT